MDWFIIERNANGDVSDKTIAHIKNHLPVILLYNTHKKNKPRYKVIDQRAYLIHSKLRLISINKEFTHYMPFYEDLDEAKEVRLWQPMGFISMVAEKK